MRSLSLPNCSGRRGIDVLPLDEQICFRCLCRLYFELYPSFLTSSPSPKRIFASLLTHTSTCPAPAYLQMSSDMSRSSEHLPEPALPAPRVSSLVYRSEVDRREPSSEQRPRPSVAEVAIAERFESVNGVGKGQCWVTKTGDAEKVHIVPHAEAKWARLVSLVEYRRRDSAADPDTLRVTTRFCGCN